MSAKDRLQREQLFHDRQAEGRAHTFRRRPRALCFRDADYLDHETWIRPAFQRLGALHGRAVLDYGCGHGMAAIVLARSGAHVTAFDLSTRYLEEARKRALANGTQIHFVCTPGECLPFADGAFDLIWGNAVLHHIDLVIAAQELYRVLRAGGHAIFCEPWGENALLSWARSYLPYPGKQHTANERPLGRQHVELLQKIFPCMHVEGYQLLGMARRVFGHSPLLTGLDWCDQKLLACVPRLGGYCRYVVLTLGK
jgi:SAM-dependent methyltransferase